MKRGFLAVVTALVALFLSTGAAGAASGGLVLGATAPPKDSSEVGCTHSYVVGQLTDDPSTPYIIPAGITAITQWQTYTGGDAPGGSITLVVLHPSGAGTFTVDGSDAETLPNPLPASGVASFPLAHPIAVSAGDTVSLFGDSTVGCFFYGGDTPSGDSLFAASGTLPPSDGESLTIGGPGISPGGYALNLAVTVIGGEDVGVKTSVTPSSVTPGGTAVLTSVVTNAGPAEEPITFVDHVPSGLQIQSATSGLGGCTVSGQLVTCTIIGLPAGASVPVVVVVNAPAAGSYANSVSVATLPGLTDPNSNNTASATLAATAPQWQPVRQCVVPALPKIRLAAARTLLTDLGCTVHLSHKHSSIPKGLLIGVQGKTGTYPYQQVVTLIVSSGPKGKHKHRRH